MFSVLTLNKISETGTGILSGYNIASECADPDGIILRSFNMHDMELSDSVKAIARAGAGTNNIPVDKYAEKGVVVFNTPGANANAVKELVIASLFLSCRKIYQGISWAQSLKGQDGVAKTVEKGKGEFVGPEVMGKKIGVIGLGAIGVMVANTCKSLGMEVIGYDPYLSVDSAWSLSRSVNKASGLDSIFAECDFISIHIPLNDETKGMFNDEVFDKCKDGLRLLNFSRGELVDNTSIKKAVEGGKVACYVTDFPNEDLLGVDNIVTIPHLGASTPESEENCAVMAANQLKDYLEHGNIVNSVNYPNCSLPYAGKKRICILHLNKPNVVGPITTAVANSNLNIDNMINKSKGSYGYTIIDIDQSQVGSAADDIAALEGVLKVRVI